MQIQTSRFGSVTIGAEDVLNFPEGLLGFNELRQFVLLDDPTDEIFAWLQSCEEPNIAFPLLEPELFTPTYAVHLTKHDLEILHLESTRGVRYFRHHHDSARSDPNDGKSQSANRHQRGKTFGSPVCASGQFAGDSRADIHVACSSGWCRIRRARSRARLSIGASRFVFPNGNDRQNSTAR